jgi:hypothetical protein
MAIVLDGTSGINTPNTFGYKNLLIDAGFTINQRAYVSGATLASGSYGHDRWKAGASGGNYTFTQLASSTTITIASGKSLIQVIEDKNVNGTSFVLSWTGTAQARYAVNSATPSGSYATSPILITGQTVGTTMSVEFNEGTLSKPQLELGAVATSFDVRDYGRELIMCQRYFQTIQLFTYCYAGNTFATNDARTTIPFFTPMRVAPTGITNLNGGSNHFCNAGGSGSGSIAFNTATTNAIAIQSSGATGLAAAGGSSALAGTALLGINGAEL